MKVSALHTNWSNTSWSSWINPYHQLETRISAIAGRAFGGLLSTKDIEDLQKGLKLAHGWTWPAGRMKNLLSTLPKEIIKALMLELLAAHNYKDFERFSTILTENALLDLSGYESGEAAALSFKIHQLTKSTALKNAYAKESRVIWREFLVELKYFIHQILDLLISIVGINEMTRKKVRWPGQTDGLSSFEANSKLELYLKIISYPAALFGIIYYYITFQPFAVFLTLATMVAVLVAAVAYNRYWKPCPIDHAGLKNLSIELLRENDPIYPRKDILKKIEEAFQAKKGVILVGAPGEGKSWIARSFVQQVAAGKICSFLKNPQVFSCNGSNFSSLGMDSTSLVSIEDSFKRHREQVVFFFDEFHSFFKKNKLTGDSVGEQIKTFCEDFKYIIGATTIDEYDLYIKGKPAIDKRRFTIIHVNTMDPSQIKVSLSQYLESKNSKINFDSEVFNYIIENAKNFNPKTSTVDAAHSLLNCAIQKMTPIIPHALEVNLINLEDQLSMIEQELINGAAGHDLEKMRELKDQLEAKKIEIVNKTTEINQNKWRIEKMQKMEAYHLKLKLQSYSLAKPHIDLSKDSALAQKWNALRVCIQIVAEFVAKERAALGLPSCLDKALIDRILEENSC